MSERYEAEILQGQRIVAGAERAWGWSGPAGLIRAERRAAFLVAAARLRPGTRVLELGCGTGEFTKRLVHAGCELTAVDISEASVERCRERLGAAAEVIVGNIETGEGISGDFDAIVGVSVLHHVDVDLTLRNVFPRLRPGGRFAFSEPNIRNPQVWAERRFGVLRRMRHVLAHEIAFSAAGLRRLFEAAGLEVELAEPFEFLHASTPGRLIPVVETVERVLEATPARSLAGSVRIAGRRPSPS